MLDRGPNQTGLADSKTVYYLYGLNELILAYAAFVAIIFFNYKSPKLRKQK